MRKIKNKFNNNKNMISEENFGKFTSSEVITDNSINSQKKKMKTKTRISKENSNEGIKNKEESVKKKHIRGCHIQMIPRNPMNLAYVRERNEKMFGKGRHSSFKNFTKGAFGKCKFKQSKISN